MQKKFFLQGYWVAVLTTLAFMCMGFFNMVSINVSVPAISALTNIPTATLLYFNTIGGLLGIIVAVVAGKIITRFGAKRCMVVGAVVAAIAYSLIPQSKSPVLIAICMLINSSMLFFYCSSTVPAFIMRWWPRNKGTLLGIVTCGVPLCNLIMLTPFNKLTLTAGIRTSMPVFSLVLILLAVLVALTTKETPAECGCLPDNKPLTEADLAQIETIAALSKEKSPWTIRRVLANRNFVLTGVLWGLVLMSYLGVTPVAVSIMVSSGVPQLTAVSYVSIGGIIGIVGSLVSGVLDDHLGVKWVCTIYIALLCVGFVLLAFTGNIAIGLMIFGYFVITFVGGAVNNLPSSHAATKSSPRHFTPVYAVITAVYSLFRAFGTSISGFSFENFGSYRPAFILYIVVNIIAIVLLFVVGNKPEPVPTAATKSK